MNDFEKAMIDILGKDAFYSTDFKTTASVVKLSKALSYLYTQISMTKRYMDKDGQEYVESVKKSVTEILTPCTQ